MSKIASISTACDEALVEGIAIAIWFRVPSHTASWANDIHKEEYRDAARKAIEIIDKWRD